MTLTESIKTCLTTKYADFKGRASRSEFWWFYLFVCVVLFIFALVTILLMLLETDIMSDVSYALLMLVMLALMLPVLSAMVRRLHDTGKSGWWLLISFIPWIGNLILLVLLLMPSIAQEAEMPIKTEEKEAEKQPLAAEEKVTDGLLTAEANAKEEDNATAEANAKEEKPLQEEERKNLAPFTLPLTLGFAMAFAPFNFWVMRLPEDMISGQGAVALVLLMAGIGVAIWKKLRWPKDKWLWIATGFVAALLLTAVVCRLFFHNNVYLTLSLFLFYPLWLVYFGIRFWQANKE
ncbi:MAG: DUF805 domain-containing protein [Bacteroidales bacterium]|nr:DUF805 domain-containing protein [Candidatus Colicola faecequi]